jgi:hypothetical protein
MKKTKTIHLEIHPDKVAEFYFSLLRYKISDQPNIQDLEQMANAIDFDYSSLVSTLELSETQKQKIDDKLHSIHKYLLKSKKDSDDYFEVSKEDFERFKASGFIAELYTVFHIMEISKIWMGKEERAEIKAGIATFSYFCLFIGNAIQQGLSKNLTDPFSLINHDNPPFKLTANESGNFCYNFEDNGNIEFEVFVETNGEIVKTAIILDNLEAIFEAENITSAFLKSENQSIQIIPTDNSVAIIIYDGVKVENDRLNLTEAKTINTFTVPKEQFEKFYMMKANNTFIYNSDEPILPNGIDYSTTSIHDSLDFKKNSNVSKSNSDSDMELFVSTFNALDESFSTFLKLPLNKREETEARDRIIIGVYNLLKKHYPSITLHACSTVTGYISSTIGLLDTEVQHENSCRKQPYRKYLRDSINNILHNH